MKDINRNSFLITIDFFKYLPSRFYVLSNIILILPLFTRLLSVKEMGLFQISISLLNLICTIFFDWVSKAVLRFYEEYQLKNMLSAFFSSILWLFFVNYLIFGIVYLILGGKIALHLNIDKTVLFSIMIIVCPVLVRQFLYQMLRLLGKNLLYTFSIVAYQIILVALTLLFIKIGYNNVSAILWAMAIAITILDLCLIKTIFNKLDFKQIGFDLEIIKKVLKYGVPLVCTNFFIWGIYHYNKYYFQYNADYNATGELALAHFMTATSLAAVFSTLLFSVFPRLIKRYETKRDISKFVTDVVRLYFIYFLPLTMVFCFYSQNLLDIFSNNQYCATKYVLPIFAISCFVHELGKIVSVKYHLLNKNYIDMISAMLSFVFCIILNRTLVVHYGLIGSAFAMLCGFLLWCTINSVINFRVLKFIDYKIVFKTVVVSLIISVVAFVVTLPFEQLSYDYASKIIQILVFVFISYFLTYRCRNFILK